MVSTDSHKYSQASAAESPGEGAESMGNIQRAGVQEDGETGFPVGHCREAEEATHREGPGHMEGSNTGKSEKPELFGDLRE